MDDVDILQNQLKQQVIDDEVTTVIDDNIGKGSNTALHNTSTTTSTVTVSLQGARYAKEWSFSSALAGYGFDLLWTSGKIWSFLVEEERICHQWVEKLNESIQFISHNKSIMDSPQSQLIAPHHVLSLGMQNNQLVQDHNSSPDGNKHSAVPIVPSQLVPVQDANAISNEDFDSHRRFLNYHTSNVIQQEFRNNSQSMQDHPSHIVDDPIRLDKTHPSFRTNPKLSTVVYRDRYGYESIDEDAPPPPPPPTNSNKPHQHITMPHFQNISAIPAADSGSELSNQDRQGKQYFMPSESGIQPQKPSQLQSMPHSHGNGNPSSHATERVTISNNDGYYNDMRSIFENTKKTIISTENELNTLRNSNDFISLQIRCQQLEQLVDDKEHALEAVQNNSSLLTQEYQEHIALLQTELQNVKKREEDIAMKFQKEIDDHLVRASNENNSFYDATVKNIKVQHQREISILQDEIADERRKHQQSLEKEINKRKRVEEDERNLKAENNRLLDRLSILEFELQQTKDNHNQQLLSSDREKRRLQLEHDKRINDLQSQLDETQRDAEKSFETRLSDIRSKYESTIRNVKEKELQLMKQEIEGDRIRCLLEYQKKCELDIETARSEERKLAAIEVEKVRQSFIQREQQTAKDLIDLEKLHAKRVDQLQEAIVAEQQKYQGLKEEYQQTSLAFERKIHELIHQIQQLQDKNHESVIVNDSLQREMKSMNERVEDRALKEVHYREELSKALTELRLLQAEKLELSAQSSNSNAQSMQWRQILQDQESRYAAIDAQFKITKEENSMLEHEAARLKQENENLKRELEKCERLIYGVSQHRVDQKKVVAKAIEPSRYHASFQKHGPNDNYGLDTASMSFATTPQTPAPASAPSSSQRTNNFIDYLNNTQLTYPSRIAQSSTTSPVGKKTPKEVATVKKLSPPTTKSDLKMKRSTSPTNFTQFRSQEMTISRAAKLPISINNGLDQDQEIIALVRKNKQILSR